MRQEYGQQSKEPNSRCDTINQEISAIGAKTQVGKEVRVKLKLFKTCLMPALLYGMEAWKKWSNAEIQNVEKIQGKALKKDIQSTNNNTLYWTNN